MSVRYLSWITRDMLRAAPNEAFVFGDNAARVGLGGQAKEMRGEPNAWGVATLYAPGNPYDASSRPLRIVVEDLNRIGWLLGDGKVVNVPRDGLGTGLARLAEHRPDLLNLITAFFRAADGEPCPWEFI
jgi:hypothetical protein